jgi:chitinase
MPKVTGNKSGKIIMAYLSDNSDWDADSLDVSKVTHICYAFGVIKDGKVTGSHWKKVHLLKELKKRNPALKILLSVGGWGMEGFSDAVFTDENRRRFTSSAAKLIWEHDFDGLDLDWEYPCRDYVIKARPEDRHNYTRLVRMLRHAFKKMTKKFGKQYLLAMAAGGAEMFAQDIEIKLLEPYFDFMSIMTYELHNGASPIAGHHTNLYNPNGSTKSADTAIKAFIREGMPPHKLLLGSAFYGRGWSGMDSTKHPLFQPGIPGVSASYQRMLSMIENEGYKRYWDDDAKAPYIWNGNVFISYDDPRSLKYKARYVKNMGLGGIFFWEWSSDYNNELLDAIYFNL